VLHDGGLAIWESLAILEYVAERFPEACGWPRDPAARAIARALSAEMQAGFNALRGAMPFNCRARKRVALAADVQRDVARVAALWTDCRTRFGAGGQWLFGAFSPADAMFAPVALRFVTYGVALDGPAAAYTDAIATHPAVQEWIAAGRLESEVIEASEVGSPL
jgi:glutathione S-transferase